MRPAWSKVARGVWLAKVDVRGTILSLMVSGVRGAWAWSVSSNIPLVYHAKGIGCATQAEAFAEATSAAIGERARREEEARVLEGRPASGAFCEGCEAALRSGLAETCAACAEELEARPDDGDRFDSDPAQRPHRADGYYSRGIGGAS